MDTASDLFCGDTPAPQSPGPVFNDQSPRNPHCPKVDDGHAGMASTDSEMVVNTVQAAVEETVDAAMETASLLFYNETPAPQDSIPLTMSGGTGEHCDSVPENIKSPGGVPMSPEVEPSMNLVSVDNYTTDRVPSGISALELQDDPYGGAKTPGNIEGPLHMTVDDYAAALIAGDDNAGDTTEEDPDDYAGVRTPGVPGHASTHQSDNQVHGGIETPGYPATYHADIQDYEGPKTPDAGYNTAYQSDAQDYAGARTPGSTVSAPKSGRRDNAAAYRQSIYDRMNDIPAKQGQTSSDQHGGQRNRLPGRTPKFAEATMIRRPGNDPMSPGNHASSSGSRTPGSRFAVSSIRDSQYDDDLGDDASALGDDVSAFGGNENGYGTYRYATAPRGLNDYRPNFNLGSVVGPFKVPARPASSARRPSLAAPVPVNPKGKAPAAITPARKAAGSTNAAASAPARRESGARTPGARAPMPRTPAAKASGARTPARTVPGAKTPSQKTLSNLGAKTPSHGYDNRSDDENSQYSNATRKSTDSLTLPMARKSVPAKRKRVTPASDGDDSSPEQTPKRRAPTQRKPAASRVPKTPSAGKDSGKKRAPPRNGKIVDNKPIPRSFDECDEADKALITMRENNVPWNTVKQRYCEITGAEYGKSTLPNRYERLMTNFIIIRDEDNVPLLEAKKEIEDEFDDQKWDLIAQRLVDRSGGAYDGITLQRHFKRLMMSQGFNVNDGMASTDPDFRSGGTPAYEEDDEEEGSDGEYQD